MGGLFGGGGGSSEPSRTDLMQQAFVAGQQGVKYSGPGGVHEMTGGGGQDVLDAWLAGQQAAQPPPEPHYGGFEFSMPHYPSQPHVSSGPTYEEQVAEQERIQKEAEERQARIQGENERDQLYADYMDAASTATDFINSEIEREMANANLLGIDYSITDEMKSQRISDYFATIWGEGEQARLEALFGEWGTPEGFSGFTITRGDASKYAGTKGKETEVGRSRGQRPLPTLVTDEEDTLGSSSTLLGA